MHEAAWSLHVTGNTIDMCICEDRYQNTTLKGVASSQKQVAN